MGSDQINIIDLEKLDYIAHVPVGGLPRPYVVTPDGKTIDVALTGPHGFVEVDLSSQKIVRRVVIPAQHPTPRHRAFEPSDTFTHGLALSPEGNELWVTSLLDNRVDTYNLPANRITGQVPVGDGPNWVVFSPDGKYVVYQQHRHK
jgi:DNA-binding beta-propeller fold protein YncE